MTRTGPEHQIETAVKLLAACHNKTLPQAALDRWIRKLAPFAGKSALFNALEHACDAPKMPACSEIIADTMEAISRDNARGVWKTGSPYIPTPEERRRADHAAIKSMLWLHYAKSWRLEDFAGHTLGRLFGRDPTEALRAAMQLPGHDKESILAWMDEQQRIGN